MLKQPPTKQPPKTRTDHANNENYCKQARTHVTLPNSPSIRRPIDRLVDWPLTILRIFTKRNQRRSESNEIFGIKNSQVMFTEKLPLNRKTIR